MKTYATVEGFRRFINSEKYKIRVTARKEIYNKNEIIAIFKPKNK